MHAISHCGQSRLGSNLSTSFKNDTGDVPRKTPGLVVEVNIKKLIEITNIIVIIPNQYTLFKSTVDKRLSRHLHGNTKNSIRI